MKVGNLISGSSAFYESILYIWKFMIHVLLKPSLENFEHYFSSIWNMCNCAIPWTVFGIALLCYWNKTWEQWCAEISLFEGGCHCPYRDSRSGSKRSYCDLCQTVFCLYLSKSFILSSFRFRSLIRFEFIFMCGVKEFSNFIFFTCSCQVFPATFIEDSLSSII